MALNSKDPVSRGSTIFPQLEFGFRGTAAETVPARRFTGIDSSSEITVAGANATEVIGVSGEMESKVAGKTVEVRQGYCVVEANDIISPGDSLKSGDSGKALRLVTADLAGDEIHETAAAGNFGNQPTNDGIEVVSSSASDTTQTLTLYGTTTGTDTVVKETVTVNGTTQVSTTKTDWGQLLGAELSAACVGTITIREASANATITTIAPASLSAGVEAVTSANQQAYNVAPTIVAGGASTKQVGLIGTDSDGTEQLDSQALNGATAVTMNQTFLRVTKVLQGDVATGTTVTVNVGAADSFERKAGRAITAAAAAGDVIAALVLP